MALRAESEAYKEMHGWHLPEWEKMKENRQNQDARQMGRLDDVVASCHSSSRGNSGA